MVCVLSKPGKSLMPTTERRCRKLLKKGRAKMVCYNPFTIQMLDNKTEYTQPMTLSIDMGSKTIGYSVIVHGKNGDKIVFKGAIHHRAYVNSESKTPVLKARSAFRRTKRNRLWYRKPRFDNRKRGEAKCKVCGNNPSKGKVLCTPCAEEGHPKHRGVHKNAVWLPPTVKAKADVHIRLINVLRKYIPITQVVIETVSFDIQKILKPSISGKEYQEGAQLGFENVKMYVRYRDRYTCKMCGSNSRKLEVHHIVPKEDTGSDSPKNLVTLCKRCHNKTKGRELEYKAQVLKAIGSTGMHMSGTAQVNSFKEYIKLNIPLPYQETYGYITKYKRKKLGLEKSHINDAIAIGVSDCEKPLIDNCQSKVCKSQRRAVRQQFKANPQKGKGFVRYRQPFNQINGIGRGDVCVHLSKRCKVVIDTLLKTGKFNARNAETGRRICSISSDHLKLLQRKRSFQL